MVDVPVFDVQRFSIHDGPGIRTLVFLKGCNLRCDWCQNPESQSTKPLISFKESRCEGQLDCMTACESSAVMPEGFRIDQDKCIACMKCVEACAFDALSLIGRRMTPEALMKEIRKDAAYYQSSGGGVTFSGGEPTLYPKFMSQIIKLCQLDNINVALETCGSFSFKTWQGLLRYFELIYFDLKVINSSEHQLVTGAANHRILDNARLLVELAYPVEFRLTLVQGYTDKDDNIQNVIWFLKACNIHKLHLLTYHNMGEAKIPIINGSQKYLGLSNYPQSRFKLVKRKFEDQGIELVS